MAEKVVENLVCRACGADVRPGALFCYACGSSIAPPIAADSADLTPTRPADEKTNSSRKNGAARKSKTLDSDAIKKPDANLPEEFQTKPDNELKPAAPRREKRAAKKTVKVVWEEPESAPNVWFLVVSLILIAFAVLVLLAMLSLE